MDMKTNKIRGKILRDHSLVACNTWRVGGNAAIFFQLADIDDLSNFLIELSGAKQITWLGFGSNVLIRDGGIHGIVARVSDREVVLKVDETGNVKMKFNKSAIAEILSEPKEEGIQET